MIQKHIYDSQIAQKPAMSDAQQPHTRVHALSSATIAAKNACVFPQAHMVTRMSVHATEI
jgi:hypothetical protein